MYKIEKGVPKPSSRKLRIYPFAEMEIGDSFFIPLSDATTSQMPTQVRNAAIAFGHRHGRKFSVYTEEGGYRVWRTA